MKSLDLSSEEISTIGQCLHAAAEGPFFPDWEFQALIGLSRDEVLELAKQWPSDVRCERGVVDAIVAVSLSTDVESRRRSLSPKPGG